MAFLEQVERILQNRKANLTKIELDEKHIKDLQSKVNEIQSLVEAADDGEIKKSLPSIKSALEKLEKAAIKVQAVRSRFSRDTINIGVAGEAGAGKSTVLQKLSGLGDSQIPTGNKGYVTANRSCIFNQSEAEEAYAVVSFYSEENFIAKRIVPFCRDLPYHFNSITDFLNADFSKTYGLDDDKQVEKNTKLGKLLSMQRAYPYYRALLGSSDKVISNLEELKKYVSYPETDADCLYPPVKNVDIHCHFPSLDGVKVQLIDLPGFGEIGGVDEIQLEGLETNVDHAVVILRPQEVRSCVNQSYSNMANTLHSVQKDVKDRKNLMSYAINKNMSMQGVEEQTQMLKADLINNDKMVAENVNLYEIEAIQPESVQEMFGKILERMITALPAMDEDFLNAYRAQLGFSDVQEQLEKILEITKKFAKTIPNESTEISHKADNIRDYLRTALEAQMKNIEDSITDRLAEKLDEIKGQLECGIRQNLLFQPREDRESWEKDMILSKTHNSLGPVSLDEQSRLRIQILASYETINEFYAKEMERQREEIVNSFRKLTGSFVASNKNGSEAIEDIVKKLLDVRPETKPLIQAFRYINDISLDFRQNIYPLIFDMPERSDLENEYNEPEEIKDKPIEKRVECMKEYLTTLTLSFNDAIRNAILDKDITKGFIKSSLEHFTDIIIRKDKVHVEDAFSRFVDAYKEEVMPEKYGKVSSKKALLKLQNTITEALSVMDELQNTTEE